MPRRANGVVEVDGMVRTLPVPVGVITSLVISNRDIRLPPAVVKQAVAKRHATSDGRYNPPMTDSRLWDRAAVVPIRPNGRLLPEVGALPEALPTVAELFDFMRDAELRFETLRLR